MDCKRLVIACSLLCISTFFSYASDVDSIGIKSEESGIYVLHKVDAQETLYALSRRYGTSVESIVDNNQINGNSLSVGSVLRIPWHHGLTHMVQAGETLYSLSKLYQVPVEQVMELNDLSSNELEVGMSLSIVRKKEPVPTIPTKGLPPTWHVVGTKETLYGISKAYEISLNDLKRWNHLTSNYVQAGDTLVLSEAMEAPIDRTRQVNQFGAAESTTTATPSAPPEYPTEEKKVVKSKDVAPVKENGMAAVIDGDSDTKKYLALHRTASVGTIMRIRNEMTNLSVFVRVVGKLPDTGTNNNILLRLSKAAQEALGALDSKFRVELSYVPNQ
jgi:LysM repeat protein